MSEKPNPSSPAHPVTAGQMVYATGLTKREYIATQMMAVLIADQTRSDTTISADARAAINCADALLSALEGGEHDR